MKANNFILESMKMAENLKSEIDKAPDVLNNMLESVLPNLSNEDKLTMQSLVKESSKLMDDAKNGSVSNIQQRIDELSKKYERKTNT